MRSAGNAAAMARSSCEFLKVRMPVNEMKSPSATARSASSREPVKQCSTAGKGPLPVSSVRMRAMSASAARDQAIKLARKIRKIQMAVAVDQHGGAYNGLRHPEAPALERASKDGRESHPVRPFEARPKGASASG